MLNINMMIFRDGPVGKLGRTLSPRGDKTLAILSPESLIHAVNNQVKKHNKLLLSIKTSFSPVIC